MAAIIVAEQNSHTEISRIKRLRPSFDTPRIL
jgi:hypothetical protein